MMEPSLGFTSVIVSNSDDFKAVEGLPGDPVDLNCSVIRTVH